MTSVQQDIGVKGPEPEPAMVDSKQGDNAALQPDLPGVAPESEVAPLLADLQPQSQSAAGSSNSVNMPMMASSNRSNRAGTSQSAHLLQSLGDSSLEAAKGPTSAPWTKPRARPLPGTHPEFRVKNLILEGGGARGLACKYLLTHATPCCLWFLDLF